MKKKQSHDRITNLIKYRDQTKTWTKSIITPNGKKSGARKWRIIQRKVWMALDWNCQ